MKIEITKKLRRQIMDAIKDLLTLIKAIKEVIPYLMSLYRLVKTGMFWFMVIANYYPVNLY